MRRGLFLALFLAAPAAAQNTAEPQYQLTGKNYSTEAPAIQQMFYNTQSGIKKLQTSINAIVVPASGVTKIVAGTNISISPAGGTGSVTVNATGSSTTGISSSCAAGYYFSTGTWASGLTTGGGCVDGSNLAGIPSTAAVISLINTSTAGVQIEIVALGASTQALAGTIGASTQALATTIGASTQTISFNVGASTRAIAISTGVIQQEIVALGASTTTIAASTTTLFTLITTSTNGVQIEIVALGASTQALAGTIGASTQSIVTTIGSSTQALAGMKLSSVTTSGQLTGLGTAASPLTSVGITSACAAGQYMSTATYTNGIMTGGGCVVAGSGGGASYTTISTVNALGAGSTFAQRSTVAFDSTYFTVIDSGTNNASVISLKSGSAAAGWTRQIFLSGSGTYTTPSGAVQLRVRMVAGGGGGGACTANSGASGNTTSFGVVNVSSGNGGGPAGPPLNGQVGGTGGVGTASIRMPGGGGGAIYSSGACFYGGSGGASAMGPSPAVLNCNNDGSSALANTGAGGVGGSCSGGGGAGAGGSGGEYAELIINSPASSYPYYIGAGGAGGAAGTHAGGNGGSGIIVVDEIYPPIMAVSGTLGYVKDDFKPQANGTTKTFTLSQPPSSSSSIFVNLDGTIISGIYDYTFTAPTTITLTTAPATQCTVAAPGNCTSLFEIQYAINTSTLPSVAILTTTQTFSGQNSFSTDTYLNGTWIGSRSSPGTSSGVFLDTTTGTGGVILWSADGQTVSSGCIVAIYFDTTRGYLVESSTTVDSGSRSYGVTRDTCAPSTFCRIITHGMVYFQGNTGTTAGNLITSSTARCVGSNNGGVMYSPSVTDCSGGVRCRGYFPW